MNIASKMLKSQRKKGGKSHQQPPEVPFPNFSLSGGETPTVCTCCYDDTTFLVHSKIDMQILYSQGGFGRSTITSRAPLNCTRRNYRSQPYFKKLKSRVSKNLTIEEFRIPEVPQERCNGTLKSCEEKVNLPDDQTPIEVEMADFDTSTCEDSSSKIEFESEFDDEENEALELMPEEVIFLTFGLGCLRVVNSDGRFLGFEELWNLLVTKNPEFPVFYAVYHFYRCKNWVPKTAENYGGDYVLYEVGPEFYHALYVVHIIGLGRPRPDWLEICSRQRCASHASKCALFCEVSVPESFSPETPMSIFQLSLKELPFYRWAPHLNK